MYDVRSMKAEDFIDDGDNEAIARCRSALYLDAEIVAPSARRFGGV